MPTFQPAMSIVNIHQNVSPTPLSFLVPLNVGGPMSPLPAPPELILLPDPIPYDFLELLAAIPGIDDIPPPFSRVVLRDGVGVRTSFESSCCSYCAP